MSSKKQPLCVAGIDVGGPTKGFHGVILCDGLYHDRKATDRVEEMVEWCVNQHQAQVIAVDAPCNWSADGRGRPAERELMKHGIWCFSSPTKQSALAHRSDYFGWMLNGEKLYKRLAATHPLWDGEPLRPSQRRAFETFPHAITHAFHGSRASAKLKRQQRRNLLADQGMDITELTNIDFVDAALCAFTAHHAAKGHKCRKYGEHETGYIIVPDSPPA